MAVFYFCMGLPNATPPCFSCIYFFKGERVPHLQGHLTMADARVWTCRIALLALTCRAHLAYFNRSHFSQPCYRCRTKGYRQESAGVWKVFQRLEVLVECHHFIAASTLGLPVVEFLNRKILFSYLEASYEIITQNLHHSKISHYVV